MLPYERASCCTALLQYKAVGPVRKTVPVRVATWNVNSVGARLPRLNEWLELAQPDVLCLQEIKCREGEFPREAFEAMGLPHLRIAGQKGWHGVAIASRLPIEDAPRAPKEAISLRARTGFGNVHLVRAGAQPAA